MGPWAFAEKRVVPLPELFKRRGSGMTP